MNLDHIKSLLITDENINLMKNAGMTLYHFCYSDDARCKHVNDTFWILCDDSCFVDDVEIVASANTDDMSGFMHLVNEDYDVTIDTVLNYIDSDDDVNLYLTYEFNGQTFYLFK
jgi:hypothetical protein